MSNDDPDAIDWSLTTWEGSRRLQVQRWAALSLDQILEAQEAMAELCRELALARRAASGALRPEERSDSPRS